LAASGSKAWPSFSRLSASLSRVMPAMAGAPSRGWPKKGSLLNRNNMARPAVKVANSTVTSNITGTKACHENSALPPVIRG
jgi:hypothetical protein